MGALRDRMLENMRMRNFSRTTIEAYLWHVTEFTRYFGKSPDLLGEEEVRRYLLYLSDERKVSWSSVNVGYSALKFFYVNTLHRNWQVNKIPRPKSQQRLPVVLSHDELTRLFSATSNLKHRVIFRTIYSAGLRVSEAANLKLFHIESSSMRIRVEQGKGKKDRYTILSETVLDELSVLYETGTHPLVDSYDELASCAQVHTYERWVLVVSVALRYAALYYNIQGDEL